MSIVYKINVLEELKAKGYSSYALMSREKMGDNYIGQRQIQQIRQGEIGDIVMPLTMGEKIKVVLNRRNMTLTQLAEKLGQSRQNMSNKMSRDNFTEKELNEIAKALDCTYQALFVMNESGEKI